MKLHANPPAVKPVPAQSLRPILGQRAALIGNEVIAVLLIPKHSFPYDGLRTVRLET